VTDALSYLFGLEQFGVKFGLENMRALVERLGHPERAFQSVHVGGTNGKGSVTAMVDAGLRAAGHRSARYTSPHIVDLNERFSIDGQPVATRDLVAVVADIRTAIDGLLADGLLATHPTFFEVTTAAAFELFRRAGADFAVVEVGLGGRLDATNVLSPIVTAITSIALDHEQYLGTTYAAIAAEKAGILKPGIPVVVGALPPDAQDTIEAVAREREVPVVHALDGVVSESLPSTDLWGPTQLRLRTPARDYGHVTVGLRGAHQVANATIAVRLLEVLDAQGIPVPADAVAAAIRTPEWPGRLQLLRLPDGRELLLDAAHNPAGAAALASYLQARGPRLPLVFGAMRDKDTGGMLRVLLPVVDRLVVTGTSARRSADPAALADASRHLAPGLPIAVADSVAHALDAAWHNSRRIVVAGSIFLLGDVMEQLRRS
jgi:dihydrofolate synthase/folylpolyglutamate synthase